MIRIFIGYDDRERVSAFVLADSIVQRSSVPVSISFVNRANLAGVFERERGRYESSDFSLSRFMVPYLCGFEGWSVFMDCDMVCLGDVEELARYMSLAARWTNAVFVVKHDYEPREHTKFLGEKQMGYDRKNWSSVMVFNNALCTKLTPEYVANATGLELHQFKWLDPDYIGTLPKAWNYLVGEDNQCGPSQARLVHFTNGAPCFADYANCEFSQEWWEQYEHMTHPLVADVVDAAVAA